MASHPPTTHYSWQDGTTRCIYITDADQADAELSKAFQATPGRDSCGLDIEWKPNFIKGQVENPVALLQLANVDTILLLHLCHMSRFPKQLQRLLEDANIIKAGVGIQGSQIRLYTRIRTDFRQIGDAKKIYKDCSVNIRSCVDLSLLARSVDNPRWKGRYNDPIGLARLIATYENRLLSKGKITRSNWENFLDLDQQEYASNDGHAGYALYTKLSRMIPAMSKPPSPTCYTFDIIRGRLCEPSGMTWSPFNPDYDPGPPPPPKPVPARTSSSTGPVLSSSGTSSGLKRPLAPDSSPVRSNKVGKAGNRDDSTQSVKPRPKRRPRPRGAPAQ
ncbi:ribonuclease H-like domain-containing protein [Mycena rosella]|uniref:3'-5' exonuclease n=1 Tax=Mycena rosella TaxID=1033263 RepID=A0AAD7G764_MYCRO|nr:ribonuclease H-like domain-containing protein [Mycena rosella]